MDAYTFNSPPQFAQSKFDLNELYRRSFGYVGIPYVTARPEAYVNGNSFLFDGKNADLKEVRSFELLGRPFFMETKLKAEGDQNWTLLPNAPLISLVGRNKIIRTEIDGNDGTFKQRWGQDDWYITIQGIVVDETCEDGEYPEQLVNQLGNLFNSKKSLHIQNDMLTLFNITYFSAEVFELPGEAGAQEFQAYRLIGYSDREYELEVKSLNL